MRYLLDTHVFLWWIAEPEKISNAAGEVMRDSANELVWSACSAWEVAIKCSIGKLMLPEDPAVYLPRHLDQQAITRLPMRDEHASATAALAFHHRDPFDRLLVAQAQVEGLTIISGDRWLAPYGVPVHW